MLPTNHRKTLVRQPFVTSVALETGWREANKTDIWRNEIEKIIGIGSVDKASNSCVVIYCVSCGGQRFQKNDAEMINHFKRQGASVVIALTKCDQVSKAVVKKMRDAIPMSMPVVEISSGGVLRFGKTKPFGKGKLIAEISKCVGGHRNKHIRRLGTAALPAATLPPVSTP